jgi:hypothetical protein
MRPWSDDQSPYSGDPRSTGMSGMPASEQDSAFSGRPTLGSMSWGGNQPSGAWTGGSPPINNQAPPNWMSPPSSMYASPSRRLMEAEANEPPPQLEMAQPVIPLGRFGNATGFNLKLRFLLALTLLSLAPAFLLVLLYQQVNQTSLIQVGQQSLIAAAQTDSNVLTQEMASCQAYLSQLAQQNSIAQASQGGASAPTISQAENILSTASLSTKGALAWVVLNGSDQIVAASPTDSEGQSLGSATGIVTNPSGLEKFVQTQRAAPAPHNGQTTLAVADGLDNGSSDKVWIATLAFVSPTAPAHSGVVLAIFSLPSIVSTYLSAPPFNAHSYVSLYNTNGTLLSVVGNQNLAQQVGQPLSLAPLQNAVQDLQTGQSNNMPTYNDPTTGAQEAVAGYLNKNLGMVFLVAAPPGDLVPATTGLLQGRNVPLIFLSIIVVTTLVATWVALPIVRPIRRATREILASTDDVRLLAEQAKQIAKDQRMGTVILEGAAKGLDMRRRAIARDAGLIVNSASVAATRLSQIASAINEFPESLRGPVHVLSRELYQELQTAHQLASGIASRLERDPVQTRLGNVMEGAAEISQQFDQASQQLQTGATRLEHAAESLQ